MKDPLLEYCLIQDDDCHWYVIETCQVNLFHDWIDAMENGQDYPIDFNKARVDGPHTVAFNGWREVV